MYFYLIIFLITKIIKLYIINLLQFLVAPISREKLNNFPSKNWPPSSIIILKYLAKSIQIHTFGFVSLAQFTDYFIHIYNHKSIKRNDII